ncbi:hypothetical protein [Terasakiella pusilla]|uniref:hypothetical protein n=1 Tax=Terasakiella pusilla TaxID=64973 RepID=UPI003AA7CEC4
MMETKFRPGMRRLSPAAAPVSSYARPEMGAAPVAPSQTNALSELASGLQEFNPKLQQFFAKKNAATQQQEYEAYALKFNTLRKTWAQAVEDGDVPLGASPFARKGYQEKAGQWSAQSDYHLKLMEGWKSSGLASSKYSSEAEAADAFREYMTSSRKGFIQENLGEGQPDVDWLRGFEGSANAVEQQLIQQHVTARAKFNEDNLEATNRQEIGNIFYGEATDIAGKIAELRDGDPEKATEGLRALGVTDQKFGAWVADEAKTAAESLAYAGHFQQARELIVRLDEIQDSSGTPLGETPEGRKAKVDMEEMLTRIQSNAESLEYSRMTRGWAKADRALQRLMLENNANNIPYIQKQRERAERNQQDEEARDLKFAEALSTLLTEPGKDHEGLLAELAADPNYAPLVSPLRSAWSQRLNAQADVNMTPDLVAAAGQMEVDIIKGDATVQDVLDAVKGRKIDAPMMGRLISRWSSQYLYKSQMEDRGARIKETADEGEVFLSRILSKSDSMGQETNGALVVQAVMHYQEEISEFLAESPQVSMAVIRRKRNEIIKELTDDPVYQATMDFNGRASIVIPGQKHILDVPEWTK